MFKGSGIVRRLDDCGRLSIPNEIRRRYHIKEGDAIEFGENPYSIELRKYSPIEVFGEQSKAITYAFANAINLPVILCDTYKVVASKNCTPYENKYISEELYKCMENGDDYNKAFSVLKECTVKVSEIVLIESQGRKIGALIIPETTSEITDAHAECLRVCANAIGLVVK